jgi:hypothetical protein
LTNFFVLSNIRSVSGGSSEMLRTSRCFRNNLFQSAGTRTLATVAPFLHSLSIDSKKVLRRPGEMNVSSHRGSLGGFSSARAERLFPSGTPRSQVLRRFGSPRAHNHQGGKGGSFFGRQFISATI